MMSSFNLVDSRWIPTNHGLKSLRESFDCGLSLSGNPMERVSCFKFLLAICQAACTPKDMLEWKALGCTGLRSAVLKYFEEHFDEFWLYGAKPFLQFPILENQAKKKCSIAALSPKYAYPNGNVTVLYRHQLPHASSDAEKALLLVVQQSFAFGGKKADNSIVLTAGYLDKSKENGKPSSGRPGPSVGQVGYLHAFCVGADIAETCYLNLFTMCDVLCMKDLEFGVGDPPWERLPEGEDDAIARRLKRSLMGKLVPMNRFMLLHSDCDDCEYTEGISHLSHKERGGGDLTCTIENKLVDPKAIWADTNKLPWRQLPSILSFLDSENDMFTNIVLQNGIEKVRQSGKHTFMVWAGGVSVSSNAGEQYLTGTDDFVSSCFEMPIEMLEGSDWFGRFKTSMNKLESQGDVLFSSVRRYYTGGMMMDNTSAKALSSKAVSDYWIRAERLFHDVISLCSDWSEEKRDALGKKTQRLVLDCFDEYCPKVSARQIAAWAEYRPFRYKEKKEVQK